MLLLIRPVRLFPLLAEHLIGLGQIEQRTGGDGNHEFLLNGVGHEGTFLVGWILPMVADSGAGPTPARLHWLVQRS